MYIPFYNVCTSLLIYFFSQCRNSSLLQFSDFVFMNYSNKFLITHEHDPHKIKWFSCKNLLRYLLCVCVCVYSILYLQWLCNDCMCVITVYWLNSVRVCLQHFISLCNGCMCILAILQLCNNCTVCLQYIGSTVACNDCMCVFKVCWLYSNSFMIVCVSLQYLSSTVAL